MSKDLAKIKLIYEFNPESPLFARVAEAELNEGNTDKALEIIENGLSIHPNYITAQLVLIEIFAKKGDYKKVIEKLDELRPKINDEATVNYYLEKIEEEKAETDNSAVLNSEFNKPFENELENLADTISKAKIPPVDNNTQNNKIFTPIKGNQFISETLADIYFSQGNFNEALAIFEKLLDSNPGKTEHFEQKIREIKEAMNK